MDVVDGRATVVLAKLFVDGSTRQLATWSDPVGRFDRLLLARSPDGGRVAVACGEVTRTIEIESGSELGRSSIDNSRQGLIFGWPETGAAQTHHTTPWEDEGDEGGEVEGAAVGGSEDRDVGDEDAQRESVVPAGRPVAHLSIGDGWTLRIDGEIDDDGGFSGGFVGGSMGLMWEPGTPLGDQLADVVAGRDRAAQAAETSQPDFRMVVERRGREVVLTEDTAAGEGDISLMWPPIVGEAGVLFRRNGSGRSLDEPQSVLDPGAGFTSGPLPP